MREPKLITAAVFLAGAIGMGFLTAHNFQEFDRKKGVIAEEYGYVLKDNALTYDGEKTVSFNDNADYKKLNSDFTNYNFLTMGGGMLMALIGAGFGAAGLADEETM